MSAISIFSRGRPRVPTCSLRPPRGPHLTAHALSPGPRDHLVDCQGDDTVVLRGSRLARGPASITIKKNVRLLTYGPFLYGNSWVFVGFGRYRISVVRLRPTRGRFSPRRGRSPDACDTAGGYFINLSYNSCNYMTRPIAFSKHTLYFLHITYVPVVRRLKKKTCM